MQNSDYPENYDDYNDYDENENGKFETRNENQQYFSKTTSFKAYRKLKIFQNLQFLNLLSRYALILWAFPKRRLSVNFCSFFQINMTQFLILFETSKI